MPIDTSNRLEDVAQVLNLGPSVVAEYLRFGGHVVESDPEVLLTPEQVTWLHKHLGGHVVREGRATNGSAVHSKTSPAEVGEPMRDVDALVQRIREMEGELERLRAELARFRNVKHDTPPAEEVVLGPPKLSGPKALEELPDGTVRWRPGVACVSLSDPIAGIEREEEVEVTPQFAEALNLLEQGGNMFITGQAGTGKSTLLKLFRAHTRRNVAVLAPTGIAALQVGGQTLHSFFNLPLHVIHEDDIKLDNRRVQQYCALETLVIDEVSMVRSDVMHAIDITLRVGRPKAMRHLPFGGVQVVFIGDLHQLPPVVTRAELPVLRSLYGGEFFFNAPGYLAGRFQVVELKRLFRQSDKRFIGLLNQVRRGYAPPAVLEAFRERVNPHVCRAEGSDGAEGTILLMGTNRMADDHNNRQLVTLPGDSRVFKATLEGRFDKRNLPAPEDLYLKEGAQVMFLKNMRDQGVVNGTIGRVRGFEEGQQPLVVVEVDGRTMKVARAEWQDYEYAFDPQVRKLVTKVVGRFFQYPLKLAWAITVHKSQGLTFEKAHIDLGKGAFSHGQAYVALSRCRTLEGITLNQALTQRDLIIDRFVVDFFRNRYRPPSPSKEKADEYDRWNNPS